MILIKQYKTIKLKINCNNTDYKRLQECNKESAMIWNFCIDKNNELYKKEKRLYTKKELREFVKSIGTLNICASNKQVVVDKIIDAYRGISTARKSGRTDEKYPYKIKKFYPTEWTYQFMFPDYDTNEIKLTTCKYIGDDNKFHNGKQIRLKFKTTIPKNIQILKLIYDNGFYACITYTIDVEQSTIVSNNSAAIDLGEIHSITSIDNNNNQLIITGRKIRSIKQFRNMKQAELTSKRDKCKKGSRQYKKYSRALNYIKNKTQKQLHYNIHKLTKLYADWAVEKGISTVYVGDVSNIELHHNGNSNTNQKINQWDYGKIMNLLEYKLNYAGIKMIRVSEAYSSQTCPCCGFKHKPKNRNFRCPNCNCKFHRDIVGAWNILHNNVGELVLPENNIKYLRIS